MNFELNKTYRFIDGTVGTLTTITTAGRLIFQYKGNNVLHCSKALAEATVVECLSQTVKLLVEVEVDKDQWELSKQQVQVTTYNCTNYGVKILGEAKNGRKKRSVSN